MGTFARSKEFEEAFDMFDDKKTGSLSAKVCGNVMRSLGQNPTENELDELFAQVGSSAGGSLDKATLLKAAAVMEERMSKVDQEAELLQAFAIFDKEGNGTISTRRRPASLPRGRDPSGA